MVQRSALRGISLSLGFLAILSGCSSRVATFPVTGTIRFDDGQPVRIGVVEFRCVKTGRSARAKLDDDGAFKLGTFAATDGAPAGDYQIIVVQYFNAPPPGHVHTHADHADESDHDAHDAPGHAAQSDARVASQFGAYATSPLRATVRSDGQNKFDFVVSHPKQQLRNEPHK